MFKEYSDTIFFLPLSGFLKPTSTHIKLLYVDGQLYPLEGQGNMTSELNILWYIVCTLYV